MTTEDDFQAALDAAPDDAHLRLVFADWLDEQGDERAAGYRCLGLLRRVVYERPPEYRYNNYGNFLFGESGNTEYGDGDQQVLAYLDADWYKLLKPLAATYWKYWAEFSTRRDAEDAAARAFLLLPPERQAELLAAAVPA